MFGMNNKTAPTAPAEAPLLADSEGVVIHVMPAKFRSVGAAVSNHSKTGLLIIVFGLVFMVAMVAGFYFIFFRTAPAAPVEEVPAEESVPAPAAEKTDPAPTMAPAAPIDDNSPTLAPEASTSTAGSVEDIPSEPMPSVVTDMKPAPDTDADGLSDRAETIFGADPTKADSDGDAYSDLDEIKAGYDPVSAGKLDVSPTLASYTNEPFRYRLTYPAAWGATKFGGDESLVFTSSDKQFVQMIVQPNPDKQTIESWYQKQFGEGSASAASVEEGQGWRGLWSPDYLTLYLTDTNQEYLYVLTYNLGADSIPYYQEIFRLMARSLKVGIY